jgi:transposase-like protein
MRATAMAAELEPEVEVLAKPQRRRFTAEYKRRIVRAADACNMAGGIGALLRRQGLHSSHLAMWREARDRAELAGPTNKMVVASEC